jgi:hypothetical protein
MSNTINELFVIAARKKFRFSSTKGELNVEDLFDLNLNFLDSIAVALDEKIQKAGRKSFVQKRAASTTDFEIQLEIVKFVIESKQAEIEERKAREAKAAKREFLLNLKQKKEMDQLEGLSLADIEKQLAETE